MARALNAGARTTLIYGARHHVLELKLYCETRRTFNGGGFSGHGTSGVEANGVIYLAGHLGYDSVSRTYPDGGIEPQTRKTLENIRETLRSVNAGLADVVRCQVFLTDPKDFAGMNKVYRTFFPTHPPARTTVATALVSSKAKIEIECTAVRGHAQTQSK